MRHRWSDEDRRLLASRYPHEPTDMLARDLGVGIRAVYAMAGSMGLKKSPEYVNPGTKNLQRGVVTRFKPGQKAWNKGVSYHAAGLSVGTQFKPGRKPHNTRPVGSHRVCGGCLQRKIGEQSGPNHLRWRGVHELLWIQYHGPLPEGHFVRFKPGLKTVVLEDITLDRLELVSPRTNMRRNSVHNYPQPIPQIVQLRGVLQRKINRRNRHG